MGLEVPGDRFQLLELFADVLIRDPRWRAGRGKVHACSNSDITYGTHHTSITHKPLRTTVTEHSIPVRVPDNGSYQGMEDSCRRVRRSEDVRAKSMKKQRPCPRRSVPRKCYLPPDFLISYVTKWEILWRGRAWDV
ncbi:hypothetical protein GCM10027562_13040 [Arthrobacter pigmenti]